MDGADSPLMDSFWVLHTFPAGASFSQFPWPGHRVTSHSSLLCLNIYLIWNMEVSLRWLLPLASSTKLLVYKIPGRRQTQPLAHLSFEAPGIFVFNGWEHISKLQCSCPEAPPPGLEIEGSTPQSILKKCSLQRKHHCILKPASFSDPFYIHG